MGDDQPAPARPSGPAVPQAPRRGPAAGTDPAVAARVSEILLDIERGGEDALRRYSRDLDGWDPPSFELTRAEIARARAARRRRPQAVTCSARASAPRPSRAPSAARSSDLEYEVAPGVVAGHRLVPVSRVGAYLPAGRVPLLASPFMTVLVPKVAGVPTVVACAPPTGGRASSRRLIYSTALCGADRIFALGGVQALAAMAFGLAGLEPVDMIVGAGNAYVAEAKRQLYGRVGIDLLAGPSEIAVIADEHRRPGARRRRSARPGRARTDLTRGARHDLRGRSGARCGRRSSASSRSWPPPRSRVRRGATTARSSSLPTARPRRSCATNSRPSTSRCRPPTTRWYHDRLRNYGSIFLGARATVAYSDKGATGTNHVLPTGARGPLHGRAVGRAVPQAAHLPADRRRRARPPRSRRRSSRSRDVEGLAAHGATAAKRLAHV